MRADKYDSREGYVSLFRIKRLFEKVFLDGSFQRWGGIYRGSGWDNTTARKYLRNLVDSAVFNYVMVARVDDCLRYAIEQQHQESIDYFTKIASMVDKEGNRLYDAISIDGNNTSSVVYGFLTDHEEMYLHEKTPSGRVKKKYFKDLTLEQQEEIQHIEKLQLIELRRILVTDMCDLFRELNRSTKLNDQEHRQATYTELSELIRVLGLEYKDLFLNFVLKDASALDKRKHEEMIAQLCLKVENNYSCSIKKNNLDNFYEERSTLSKAVYNRVETILRTALKASGSTPLAKKLTRGTLFNFFDAICIALDTGHKISKPEEFFVWFLEMDATFRAKSRTIIEADREEKSYAYWTKFYYNHANQNKIRTAARLRLLESKEDLAAKGIITKERPHTERFSDEDKRILWYLQKGKTREGETIDILDLYRTRKYEADHVQSIKDGGKTTISNGELMRKEANRSKGAKSSEPAFTYQKQENMLDIPQAL